MVVDEVVAAVDAVGRQAVSSVVGQLLGSVPAMATLSTVQALGPLRNVIFPVPTPTEFLSWCAALALLQPPFMMDKRISRVQFQVPQGASFVKPDAGLNGDAEASGPDVPAPHPPPLPGGCGGLGWGAECKQGIDDGACNCSWNTSLTG